MDHAPLIALNRRRWQAAKLTRSPEFVSVARRLVAAKARYREGERITGVPWLVIAVIHQREASQRWDRSIAQGDPWDKISTHVPKGRGPFGSWQDAALDALKHCAPYAANWKDWTPGGAMTLLELYNGLGYFRKGLPSPYVWSGTDQYKRGKYVADGVFDPNVIDQQLGCAGLILAMKALDADIAFDVEALPSSDIARRDIAPADIPSPETPLPDGAQQGVWKPVGALVLKVLKFLFWKRS